MASGPVLIWFRRDLRLDDNPALHAAARRGGPIVPVYVHAPEEDGAARAGPHRHGGSTTRWNVWPPPWKNEASG